MKNLTKFLILGSILALMYLPPLHAQTEGSTSADTRTSAASSTTPGQAPDEVMKKLSDLVHAGKYAEAQQLTAGLLLAYPNDQRLIKAKALLDKSLRTAGATTATPGGNQPTSNVATNTIAEQLAGMEKVDYDALIELARQAQQTTDLAEQKKLLQQFMDQSNLFLQKHPNQMLLWQLHAASAISLNEPMAGYEAGQRLLMADSNDSNVRRLLAQLKNIGWLDEKEATKQSKYYWILGIWTIHYTWVDERGGGTGSGIGTEEFTKSGHSIEGYLIDSNGVRAERFNTRGLILDSGELRWAPVSFEPSDNDKTLKIVFTVPNGKKGTQTNTWLLHKQ